MTGSAGLVLLLDLPRGRAREQGAAKEQNGNTTDTLEACLHFKAILDNAGCEPKAQKLFLFKIIPKQECPVLHQHNPCLKWIMVKESKVLLCYNTGFPTWSYLG